MAIKDPKKLHSMKLFGANLRKLRTNADLTQKELAKKINVSSKLVQAIEVGRRSMDPSHYQAVADALGVPVTALTDAYELDDNLLELLLLQSAAIQKDPNSPHYMAIKALYKAILDE